MTISPVATLPEAPITGDVNFDTKADVFLPALTALSGQLNTMIDEINDAVDVLANKRGGECRLTLSGGNLLLSRYDGYRIIIDDAVQAIPSAGVTLAATGKTANTTYYVYAYMSSGTMTLEAATTSYSADSRNGVMTKTGDTTRTLVGMARAITGPAWVDSTTQRFVLSYYNRQEKSILYAPPNTSTTSTSFVVLGALTYFLSWADTITVVCNLPITNSVTNIAYSSIACAVNGTGAGGVASHANGINTMFQMSAMYKFNVSDGYHNAGVQWYTSAGTINNNGGSLISSTRG